MRKTNDWSSGNLTIPRSIRCKHGEQWEILCDILGCSCCERVFFLFLDFTNETARCSRSIRSKLNGGRVPRTCANSQEYFRDVSDHLTRNNASLDSIRDTIGTAIQVNLSMVTIEESEVNKKLAAWAGIFAVATAFAGLWGMNFKAMPELQWEYGYPLAIGIISATCVGLYIRFKRFGWL